MATENSRVLYTERTTGAVIVSTELNALADDAAAVQSSPLSNDASSERALLADFLVVLALQGGARAADAQVSLLIVPEVNSVYGDTATLKTAQKYIARQADGTAATWTLDAATTARNLTVSRVQLPNANYKVGLLNESGQALAATLNTIWMSGSYSPAAITV
jgi:hypothetical protein